MASILEALRIWLNDLMTQLGFANKTATIVLVGLDNAGKTTLLNKLKHGVVNIVAPTQRPHFEEITFKNVTFKAWDVGGHATVRRLWKDFYDQADGVVFMVDSADGERIGEASQELEALLTSQDMAHVSVAIMANKSDLKNAYPVDQLAVHLRIANVLATGQRVKMFRTSIVDGYGFDEAFRWLSSRV